MLCQRCHKNLASVRYAEVIDGRVTDRHLCESCMAQYQEGRATGFELAHSPKISRRPAIARPEVNDDMLDQRRCPACGTLLGDLTRERRAGCAQCYSNFEDEIDESLRALHQAVVHRGKSLHLDDTRARLRADLRTKRTLLRTLLRHEKYEEAAHLRDEIRDVETGLAITDTKVD